MCRKLIYLLSFVLGLGIVVTNTADADPSLVGWWRLDEGSGTTAYDSSGNGRHGTLTGDPEWVAGKIGGALQFDGQGHERVLLGTFDVTGNAITIACWFKADNLDTPGDDPRMVSKAIGGSNDQHWFMVSSSRQSGVKVLRFRLRTDGTTGEIKADTTTGTIELNEWIHVATTWDGATMRIHKNGVEVGSLAKGGTLSTNPAANVAIGNQPTVGDDRPFDGIIDDVRIYTRALTPEEIEEVMKGILPGLASIPSPADRATDVPRDVVLSWTPGEFAPAINGHKVYLSDNFADVNDGIGGIATSTNSYAPVQRLDFDKTYYWRVDEVNGPPDYTVYQGDIWRFTSEPFSRPIENVAATASSSDISKGPENTVNGSGLDASGLLHGTDADDKMWLSGMIGPQPTWIEFQLDSVYKLHQMWVWNSNTTLESVVGLGFKDVSIEYSVNGTDYTTLGTTAEFARAPGASDYAYNTTVDFGGVAAKYVRLTVNSNWGGLLAQYGLSEVRFFHIPVQARKPYPDSGAADVGPDVVLGWIAGREAVTHDVYLSTDEQAVIDGTAAVATVTETSYAPLSLDLGATHYWKINDVNEAETPTTWESKIWSFTTNDHIVVDDFESYNDLDPGDPASKRIFNVWIDGYGIDTNGSLVGYGNPPFCEQTIVHGGEQSMPLFYDNSGTARYSEAELTLSPPQDWTKNGVKTLSLWFCGDQSNTAEQMYVKINGSKITYDSDATNLKQAVWQPWNIDLASSGIDLRSVTKLAIGFGDEANLTVGGAGVVYFDDIRLYAYSRQLITPTDPGNAGLVAHWQFDEGSGNTTVNSSGNGHDGTISGATWTSPGWDGTGYCLDFDGQGTDRVSVGSFDVTGNAISIACWFKADNLDTPGNDPRMVSKAIGGDNEQHLFMVSSSRESDVKVLRFRLKTDGTTGELEADTTTGTIELDVWIHVAATWDGVTMRIYKNGVEVGSLAKGGTLSTNPAANVSIGNQPAGTGDRPFDGLIDDVRIYDRALSQEEITWLAGRTKPIDKPF